MKVYQVRFMYDFDDPELECVFVLAKSPKSAKDIVNQVYEVERPDLTQAKLCKKDIIQGILGDVRFNE